MPQNQFGALFRFGMNGGHVFVSPVPNVALARVIACSWHIGQVEELRQFRLIARCEITTGVIPFRMSIDSESRLKP